MNKILKDANMLRKAEEKAKETRLEFIISVLGKKTYNRYFNNGTFAPVPLSAIRLLKKDFISLSPQEDVVRMDKVLDRMALEYYRNEFEFLDNGYGEYELKTDIVFKTIDEVIDFFYYILVIYKKVFKTEEINWSKIVKKFRMYI
jgi:hypothetical protein